MFLDHCGVCGAITADDCAGFFARARGRRWRSLPSVDSLSGAAPLAVTAGNSSGINDGAGSVLLASDKAVGRLALTPRARVAGSATAGVAPRIMGIGPVPAARKLLARSGHELSDIDVIELNEAFAAQSLAVLRDLGLPDDAPHVNANGGAIAIGHPLGASGARLVLTSVNQLNEIALTPEGRQCFQAGRRRVAELLNELVAPYGRLKLEVLIELTQRLHLRLQEVDAQAAKSQSIPKGSHAGR